MSLYPRSSRSLQARPCSATQHPPQRAHQGVSDASVQTLQPSGETSLRFTLVVCAASICAALGLMITGVFSVSLCSRSECQWWRVSRKQQPLMVSTRHETHRVSCQNTGCDHSQYEVNSNNVTFTGFIMISLASNQSHNWEQHPAAFIFQTLLISLIKGWALRSGQGLYLI